ncbi:hypothetical protein EMCG_05069 [[Emmonsia] crescens]|uniref:Uncharacterized protein n=1 Tax=[Emmonsia] crescens TaxID=73230 RepID=A0A0G2HPX9_9EURO|nr:hypothetical protein EMCG_05069 [Emmonsia crescens UAMH 3008]
MTGIEWSDTEKVLGVYFASRGVHRHLSALRKFNPGLGSSTSWNIDGVNHWLHDRLEHLGVNMLEPTYDELAVVQQVVTIHLKAFMALTVHEGSTRYHPHASTSSVYPD